jgi:drug/metabolite transporter (DMT)-like permease
VPALLQKEQHGDESIGTHDIIMAEKPVSRWPLFQGYRRGRYGACGTVPRLERSRIRPRPRGAALSSQENVAVGRTGEDAARPLAGASGEMSSLAGSGAAVMGTIAWGFGPIFVKLVALPGLTTSLYRLWLGAAALAIVARCSSRRWLTWREVRSVVPAGLLLCADMGLFFSALKLTSVAAATVIGALQPALVLVVAGRWFGEHLRRRDVLLTLVAIAGVVAVALGGGIPSGEGLLGDGLAFGSLIAFTGYWLVSKRALSGERRADRYTAGVMLVGAVAITPVALLSGERLGPLTAADGLWLALMTVIPGAGHLLFNWAHHHVDVSVSSVISAGNPVVAALLAFVVLGEQLAVVQWAGGAVAIVAIAGVAARRQSSASIGGVQPAGP